MKLDRFRSTRGPLWSELESLVGDAKGKPERLGPRGLLRMGELYRSAAADLAFARSRWPDEALTTRLEALVARSRTLVYDAPTQRGTVRDFFLHGYWRRILERPIPLVVAALLLFGPMIATAVWAASDPGGASNFVPAGMEAITEPKQPGQDLGLSGPEQAQFSSEIFTNNIWVTFLAFVAGIVVALGTSAVLVYNGLFVGALAGLAFDAGNGVPFVELVIAHGVLELSCIVVAGAAGLRLGWALVAPGHRTRVDALRIEGRSAIELVIGTMPWLVLAGLVEGFVTPAGFGLVVNTTIGVLLGALYWVLALRLGGVARTESVPQRRALAFARR